MKKLFLLSFLSLMTTGAVFASDRNAAPDPAPVMSGSTEAPGVTPISDDPRVTPAASCVRYWDCRRCTNNTTQNILVEECDGVETVIRGGACGQPCF